MSGANDNVKKVDFWKGVATLCAGGLVTIAVFAFWLGSEFTSIKSRLSRLEDNRCHCGGRDYASSKNEPIVQLNPPL
jgi:hypothetical protein